MGGVVPLCTVASGFQARVVAARLGADGIPVQLTGAVDGPYPVGSTTLWVLEPDLDEASALLLLDEAEWAVDEAADPWPAGPRRAWPSAPAAALLVLLAVGLLLRLA